MTTQADVPGIGLADDRDKYAAMVKTMEVAETKEDLVKIGGLYAFDVTYPRGDVLLAMKVVSQSKGWAQ